MQGGMPPQVPRAGTTRARWLARQRADVAAGVFTERLLQFDFGSMVGGATSTLTRTVPSLGGRYVRNVALRGSAQSNIFTAPTGLELASLAMRVQINGGENLIGGNGTNFVRLASLFDDLGAPWLWWHSPPLLRTGDRIAVTIINTGVGEGAPVLSPQIGFRLIDDDLWQELYTRDWRAE